MYELKNLREEAGSVANELKTLTDTITREARNMTDEEITTFDALDSKKAELESKIKTAERIERSKGVSSSRPSIAIRSESKLTARDKQDAFRAFLLSGSGGSSHMVKDIWVERAERAGYNLNSNQLIQRTDTGEDLATQGPAVIDGDVFIGLATRLKMFGGVRKVADVFASETGSPVHYAFSDDVSNVGSIVGENTAQDSVPVSYAPVTLSAYTYRSGVYPVSWQLIQDSRVDIVEDVSRKLAIRIGRRQNTDWTTGNGTGQPTGFLTALTQTITSAAVGAISYDDLNALIHTVDPLYREEEEGVCLMMNDSTAAYLEVNLKDTAGRPLFLGPQSFGNVTDAAYSRIAIMGKTFPIVINQAMPSMVAGSTAVAFGWFKAYKVRDVADVRIEVLRERYADLAAVGIQAYARSDGNLVDPNALAGLVMKASS